MSLPLIYRAQLVDHALLIGLSAFIFLAMAGWTLNVVAVLRGLHAPLTGEFLLRVVGLMVPPLGCLFGWL